MSEQLNQKIKIVEDYFKGFNGFIELKDFRSYLLFTLTSQVPNNIMAQLGFGGNREIINLPYDPDSKFYYQKINLISSSVLILYTKGESISDKLVMEKDESIFKEYLNSNEMSLAFHGKEKFLLPKVSDCGALNNSNLIMKIDDFFHSFESFISFSQPNVLFVIDAKSNDQPDLLFTFNMMPQLPGKSDEHVLKIDAYLDAEHMTRDITYIKREEDFKISYIKDLKEVSHGELYKSAFSLVIHIKSFNKPY